MNEEKPSLTLVRRLKASPARVFAAWTEPALIVQWWGPDAGPVVSAEADPRVGGQFRVVFETQDGARHDCYGVYRDIVADQRLVFTWHWATKPEVESLVTVELRPLPGGTELTLTHAQLPDEATRDSHRNGWSGTLDKLVLMLEQS